MKTILDLATHLKRQQQFSFNTFGPPRKPQDAIGTLGMEEAACATAGVQDHLRKELTEIQENPGDLEEWIDVVILAFDGALRAGYTADQIAAQLELKQTKNEHRRWPDWRTAAPGKAIEHLTRHDPREFERSRAKAIEINLIGCNCGRTNCDCNSTVSA